jgi:hypothetical protein
VPLTNFTSDVRALSEVASVGTTGYLLDTSGNVHSCRDNNDGQLGHGKTDGGDRPAQHEVVTATNGLDATALSSTNFNASVVLTTSG